jgi:hypothetical protein
MTSHGGLEEAAVHLPTRFRVDLLTWSKCLRFNARGAGVRRGRYHLNNVPSPSRGGLGGMGSTVRELTATTRPPPPPPPHFALPLPYTRKQHAPSILRRTLHGVPSEERLAFVTDHDQPGEAL